MQKICLAGYSGHAFVVAEIVRLLNYSLVGYFDVKARENNPFNIEYLGNENSVDLSQFAIQDIGVALGLGDNQIRRNVFQKLKENKVPMAVLQHPKAVVSNFTTIDEGTVIMAAAVVNPWAKIGKAVICNSGCIIEHDCIVHDYVHIAPGAVLAGNVSVGEGSFIGANACVKQGIKIGNNAIVGAGAVVISDVPAYAVVYGNPAKTKKT